MPSTMTKHEAIRLLGGTAAEAARAVGVTRAAISAWPQVLPARLRDRVEAALWRHHFGPYWESGYPGIPPSQAP